MKKLTLTICLSILALMGYAQVTELHVHGDQTSNRISQSGGTYTELAQRTWSGSAGILFSAYASDTYVNGGLSTTGNTKYKFNPSVFGSTSHGAKMIYTNHSSIGFFISPASTAAGDDVIWGDPVLWLMRGGDVGIGTIQPNAGLHVQNKDLLISNDVSTGGTGISKLIFSEGSDDTAPLGFSINYNGDNFTGGDNKLYFESPTAGEVFTIRNDGKVGIGTASTGSHKLAVNGSIGAREVKVEAGTWSDFVFEQGYSLRTLEEVEEHIARNGHLPDVPNEAQVTESGINLGEMDALLLQKIEELTLYLIEQNKKIEALQNELSVLKSK
ncbi:conserved exported hypothetical protein [Marinoscillum sp. 108]|nr:conserved exported hypothetical protein [Marinoscillum sp. 108]